jgi:predicted Zn-dependent protease with MMP-like domain
MRSRPSWPRASTTWWSASRTERYDYGGLATPDSITIFRLPILEDATSEAEVVEQVRITVIHELAHHFGIDDDRLDELGWS